MIFLECENKFCLNECNLLGCVYVCTCYFTMIVIHSAECYIPEVHYHPYSHAALVDPACCTFQTPEP